MTPAALESVLVVRCGVCGAGYENENDLRAHTSEPGADGDTHDGEPWVGHTIRVGDVTIWEPQKPHARERVRIDSIARNADGDVWVRSAGDVRGACWNELSRWCEATQLPPIVALEAAP